MKLARSLGLGLTLILLFGLAVPYIDAEGYRERIQTALERALHRKVTAGKVRSNLLTGPGFTVEDVTIQDDPSLGIEPLAYVRSLSARVELTTLWTRRLSFSNLRLNNPTVNLATIDAAAVPIRVARALPAHPATQWKILPFRIESGCLDVASPELPVDAMETALRGHTALEVRFHLITPMRFRELQERLV